MTEDNCDALMLALELLEARLLCTCVGLAPAAAEAVIDTDITSTCDAAREGVEL